MGQSRAADQGSTGGYKELIADSSKLIDKIKAEGHAKGRAEEVLSRRKKMRENRMFLLSSLAAMSLVLLGCASELAWQMPGGTSQIDFNQALDVCQKEADAWAIAMTSSGQMQARNAPMDASLAAQFDESKPQRVEACMQARGYRKTN